MAPKIAYVMSRFPHLPETFILREMIELERLGWPVALYPLIRQSQPVIHADAQPWLRRARYVPFISVSILSANAGALRRRAGDYLALWLRAFWENKHSPNFLLRAIALLPKAVYTAQRMQEEGVTHIHAHYASHPALFAWLIHRLTGITYSLTAHAHDIFVRTAMLATKLREAAFVVAISEYNRQYLAQRVGSWVQDKIHVVHCGIASEHYVPRTPKAGDERPFEIINVGSLQPYKGHRYLVEACALLRQWGVPFRCRIIGGGEEEAGLARLITAAGLDSKIELLGPQPQEVVTRFLPTADCYVQPSVITPSGKMEGIPVALMEALACELPVVATSLSGIPELVRHNETGYLVPPADAPALAKALAATYADPASAARMAQAGRALVLQEFELQSNVGRLAHLFEQYVYAGQSSPGLTSLAVVG